MSSQVLNEGLISHQLVSSLEDQKLVINPVNQSMDESGLSIEKCEMGDIQRAKKSSPKKMFAFKRFFRWKAEVEPLTPTSDVPSSPIDRGSFKSENEVPSMIHTASYNNFLGLGDSSRNVLGPQGKPDLSKSLDSPKRLISDNSPSDESNDCKMQSSLAVVAVDAEAIHATSSDEEVYLDKESTPKEQNKVTGEEDDEKDADGIPTEISFASELAHQTPMESKEILLDTSVENLVESHVVPDDCYEYEPDAQLEMPPPRRSMSDAACVHDNVPDEISYLSIAEIFSCEIDAASSDLHTQQVIRAEHTKVISGDKSGGQVVQSTTLDTNSQSPAVPEKQIALAPFVVCEALPSSIALTIPQAAITCPIASPTEEIQNKVIKEVIEDNLTPPQAQIDNKCITNNDKKVLVNEVVQGAPKRVDRHAFLSFGNLRFSTAQVPKIIPEEKPPAPTSIGRVINGISLAEVEARCKPRFIQPVFTNNEAASFDDDSEGEGGESPCRDIAEQSAVAETITHNEEEKEDAEEEVDQDISNARQAEMLLASLKSARFAKRLDYLKVVDRLNQTKATHAISGESADNTGDSLKLLADDTQLVKESCNVEVAKTTHKLTNLIVPKVCNKPDSPSCSPGARPVKLANIVAATTDTVDSSVIDPVVEASNTIDLQIHTSPANIIEVELKIETEVDVHREVQKNSSVSNFFQFARLFSPKTSICCAGAMSVGPCYSPFVDSAGVDGEKNNVTVTCETVGEEGYKSNSDGEELSGI
jgi:hypothetical protein